MITLVGLNDCHGGRRGQLLSTRRLSVHVLTRQRPKPISDPMLVLLREASIIGLCQPKNAGVVVDSCMTRSSFGVLARQ